MNNYISWGINNQDFISKLSNEQYVFINAFGEFIGMFIFIFLLIGSIANFNLQKSKFYNEKGGGWIILGISLGLLLALLVSLGIQHALFSSIIKDIQLSSSQSIISNALNPIFILSGLIKGINLSSGYIPIGNGFIYLLSEFIGALLGAYFAYLVFKNLINQNDNLKLVRGCFYTSPVISKIWHNLFVELFATLILSIFIFSTQSIFNENQSILKIITISLAVGSIGYGVGGITGYALNPFRDLCPKIIYNLLLGKKDSSCKEDWKYSVVPILGPIIGCLFGLIIMPGFLY